MNNLLIRKYQKNRFFKKPKKIILKFGSSALVCSKEGRLELIQLTLIKFFLKKNLKNKKINFNNSEKIWYFGKVNFYLQKKSKNSRMGKGKGMLERGVLRLKKNHVLFEFEGYSQTYLKNFLNNINKKLNLNFYLYKKKNFKYRLWSNNFNYLHYFDKYLSF